MKNSKSFTWLLLFFSMGLLAQSNVELTNSTPSMGFATSRVGKTEVRSVVGQAFGGPSQGIENKVESGFLGSDFLVNNNLISIPEDTVEQLTTPDILLDLPDGFLPTSQLLFFRQGGKLGYQLGEVVPEGTGFRLSIPENFITERGLEYYLVFRSDDVVVTFPARNPAQQPAITRVSVPRLESPLRLAERTYRMISMPMEISGEAFLDQLRDDYGDYNVSRWRLFRYIDGDYVEGPELPENFLPGQAFWLITEEGRDFTAANGISTNTGEPFVLELAPGWNQIGNPFSFPVDWSGESDSLLEPPIFFDGTDFISGISTLQPWEGYWVFNRGDGIYQKLIEPRETDQAVEKQGAPESEQNYRLNISAFTSQSRDQMNAIGLINTASDEIDRLDYRDPPAAWNGIRLSIRQGEESFAGNFKSWTEVGKDWDLLLTNRSGGETITLKLAESGEMPAHFQTYVFDLEKQYLIPVSEGSFQIHLDEYETERNLRIVLGTKGYAESVSDGISMVPLDYRLSQNYPNPFNPQTTIAFELRELGEVKLEIYNILGQRVKTLINGKRDAGRYTLKWNGLNDAGNRVASGVYLYRLQAGWEMAENP